MGWGLKSIPGVGDALEKITTVGGVVLTSGQLANTARDGWNEYSTSDLIKTCKEQLHDMEAKDIPAKAGVESQTSEFVQRALGIKVDGDAGTGTIGALNKRIETEFAPKPEAKTDFTKFVKSGTYADMAKGAVADKFEDLKEREYKSADDIDGRTLEFLTARADFDKNPLLKQDFAEAMNEIGQKTGNAELQMAAHKLEPTVVPEPKVVPDAPELGNAPEPGGN